MDDTQIGVVLIIFLILGTFSIVAYWAHSRWRELKPELFPPEPEEEAATDQALLQSKEQSQRIKDVKNILTGLHGMLEKDETPGVQGLVNAAQKVEAAAPELANTIESVLSKSRESGEVHSLLIKLHALYAYIVVVPNRHEHPHLIRRHEAFSAGWIHHTKLIKASLVERGTFSALVGYLFFVSTNNNDGVLLLSYIDDKTFLVPSSLIQLSELTRAEAQPFPAMLDFSFSR